MLRLMHTEGFFCQWAQNRFIGKGVSLFQFCPHFFFGCCLAIILSLILSYS